ncbi:hypothetical protein [Actinoplanes sp. ATCC 53533]|uniref:hypothetical protein n=1 Tax=Actinoplanes sp. ATCC 53533 TaxID=1288362 RepID=UPI00131559C4|nr:hypothetical protein [Actinoplanes sp. ATCC 53533]
MSRTPLPRPTLLPGLPRIWRTPHTLQLGLDPARAVLLDLPEPGAARLLDLLDGSRSERHALAQAGSLGIRPGEAAVLLDTLHEVGLVVPAQSLFPSSMPARLTPEAAALAYSQAGATPARTLRRRAAARVVVTGPSRLAAGVAVALATAGTGHVHPDLAGQVTRHEAPGGPLTESDIGKPRAEAVAAAIQRSAPETKTRTVRRGAASLVIQLGRDHPATPPPVTSAQRNRPHLTATIREGVVMVGPLILPATSPCPNCMALHLADRESLWQTNPPPPPPPPPLPSPPTAPPPTPASPSTPPSTPTPPSPSTQASTSSWALHSPLAWIPASPPAWAPPALEPCGVATFLAAVAFITGEALAYLDEETPETLGVEVAVTAPGRTRRRTWPPHPNCGCSRLHPPVKQSRHRTASSGMG